MSSDFLGLPGMTGGSGLASPLFGGSSGGGGGIAGGALAQDKANRQAILNSVLANRVSQSDPFGSVYWTDAAGNRITPDSIPTDVFGRPKLTTADLAGWSQNTELSPEMQQLLSGAQSQALQRFSSLGAEMPSYSPMGTEDARNQAQTALFERSMALAAPEMERSREALEERLANQGIPIGSEAYQSELGRLGSQQDQMRQAIMREAIIGGGAEADRLQSAGIRDFQAALTGRGAQSGELGQALGAIQGFRTPNAMQPAQYQYSAPDYLGAAASQYSADQQANAAKKGGTTGLVGTLGAAAIMSDRKMKKDISKVGSYGDYNVYQYRYKDGDGSWHIGVMADEVKAVNPAAVINIDGIDHVNYGAL